MAYEIYGPFSTIADARKTIDILGLEGVKNDHIFVFANEDISTKLQERTDAHMENDNATNKTSDHPFINKMKHFFSNEDSESTTDMREKLRDLGIDEKQLEAYMPEIEAGNILIVADNEKRMGHDPVGNTDEMEVKLTERE